MDALSLYSTLSPSFQRKFELLYLDDLLAQLDKILMIDLKAARSAPKSDAKGGDNCHPDETSCA